MVFVLLTPTLLLIGSGVVFGMLSKQTVSEKEKEAAAGILLKESDLIFPEPSVEPPEPTIPEEEAFEKKLDACYADGNPSERDGGGFVFENYYVTRVDS